MSTLALRLTEPLRRIDAAILFALVVFTLLILFDPPQAGASLAFTAKALVEVGPFLAASIFIAAYASASGADNLIARAFQGRETAMIFAAALMGGLSPFCSCGVIPLIAALLAMGVPLAPVMAFWLASPIMDPTMFVLTTGTLGLDFAIAKTAAAIGLGLIGGFGTMALIRSGHFQNPLREGIGNGGCGGSKIRNPKDVTWKFWNEPARREVFGTSAWKNTLFLGKWLALAFILESVMLAYIPADFVKAVAGGSGFLTVLGATIVGIPAYLNGYAALPVVQGLIEQGMAEGAGMAFLVAGGVTSIPAAIAVFALARKPVFFAYIAFSLVGAFLSGMLYQTVWVGV
ncbi:MAG: permease [Pseudomonadota bacterium]